VLCPPEITEVGEAVAVTVGNALTVKVSTLEYASRPKFVTLRR
jgi:hypothetical protein